jgi:glycosyltransferase involved in cell wall biosynthesis
MNYRKLYMKYNIVEEEKIPSVAVITPTTGKSSLSRAMRSVANQTFKNVHHYIVVDGPDFFEKAFESMECAPDSDTNFSIHVSPCNTGAGGFYGHRIYAAYPHLLNEDYIAFLDDDNWFEPNHIESLVTTIQKDNLAWAHSLRKVWINSENFLADDKCESIGRWPIWFTQENSAKDWLVDTSSFCFRRSFLIHVCQLWHSGWGGDRRFFKIIKDNPGAKYDTTGIHTMNYILPDMNKAYGGDLDFFHRGNKEVQKFYGGKYPWEK